MGRKTAVQEISPACVEKAIAQTGKMPAGRILKVTRKGDPPVYVLQPNTEGPSPGEFIQPQEDPFIQQIFSRHLVHTKRVRNIVDRAFEELVDALNGDRECAYEAWHLLVRRRAGPKRGARDLAADRLLVSDYQTLRATYPDWSKPQIRAALITIHGPQATGTEPSKSEREGFALRVKRLLKADKN